MFIAHRGESYLAPENTIAAINLAWENEVKAVEIDVRLTADNEIVVIHDKNTKRTGNINLTIRSSTLKELKTIDVGFKKGSKWKGENIPSLKEVIDTLPEKGKLIIELKSGIEIISPLVSLIRELDLKSSQIEIISFNHEVLNKAKKLLPEFKILWLLDLDYYLPFRLIWINKKKLVQKVLNSNLDGVNVWAGKTIDKQFVEAFRSKSLLVYCWTVNDPAKASRLLNINVNAITTDRPHWLKQQLIRNLP